MANVQSTIDEALQLAVRHHQRGDAATAERIYRQILSRDSRNADALHLLGVLAGQCGQLDQAVSLIGQAISVRPDFPDAFRNLGRIYADQKNLPMATTCYRQVTKLLPRDANAWHALGIALRMEQKREDAVAALHHALVIDPNHADAFTEIGGLLRAMGRLDESVAAFARVVAMRPDSADAHSNLGIVLIDKGRLEEAEFEYERAIALSPDTPRFQVNLGNLQSRKNLPVAALQIHSEVIESSPAYAPAYSARGTVLAELNRFDEALADHRRAVQLAPEDVDVPLAMVNTLSAKGEVQEAERLCRHAIQLDSKSAGAWECLGRVQQRLGHFEDAANSLRRSLEIQPSGMVYMLLGTLIQQPDSSELERLTGLLSKSDLPPDDRVAAGFALGKLLDEADRFEEAFASYSAANILHREISAAHGHQFDPDALQKQIDGMIETFTPDFFKERAAWGKTSEVPVFIVGMPRSGTTLVEQIAASHSKVFGAGELPDIGGYLARLNGTNLSALEWDQESISHVARAHLNRLKTLGGAADRVIDKMPANILNLGLIATLFPKARVIFCQRDPRDNCLSCFFQLFGKTSQMFSYDLADCARQYQQQQRLTAHWQQALPVRMMTMQYEELVADLEGQSRRLIEFLGLDWEEKCLDFHKNNRAVMTSSVWQVRQPIYTRSVGRWKHYEKHLGPLLAALGEMPAGS